MASELKAIRLLLGLLLVSGSYTTSALSVSQRQNLPAIWLEEKTITNDNDDDESDDVVVTGQRVYDGWGDGWSPIKIGAREPVEPAKVEDEDFRYVYREPEVEEKREARDGTRRKSKCVGLRRLSHHLLKRPRSSRRK